jgi:HD-GYP domain-containing protein (c-di-GMP phosphodiesterase class II)
MAKGSSAHDRKGHGQAATESRAERGRRRTLFFDFTAVFAVTAVVIVVVAGFALGGYLTSGIQADAGTVQQSAFIAMGASLAALYLVLALLVRRGSEAIRRQQTENEGRADELKDRYESIVAVLCAALDLQDNVTQGHARRVSEIASVVAWQMGLRKEQLRQIEKAAILHDIGKIGVADAVLAKPGPLNETEWEEMRRHPELGRHVLSGIDFLRDAAEVVYAHHERWDGQGYPLGLKGEEIPLGARIFAVVDAYCAMTSHRPYRKAMPHSRAIDEILRNAGGQFDPAVVRVFTEAERQGLIDEEQHNGHGRRSGQRVLQRGEEVASAAGERGAPVYEETVPAAGE